MESEFVLMMFLKNVKCYCFNINVMQVVGSRNPHNTVKALFKALNAVSTYSTVLLLYTIILTLQELLLIIFLLHTIRLKPLKMFSRSLDGLLLSHTCCDRQENAVKCLLIKQSSNLSVFLYMNAMLQCFYMSFIKATPLFKHQKKHKIDLLTPKLH